VSHIPCHSALSVWEPPLLPPSALLAQSSSLAYAHKRVKCELYSSWYATRHRRHGFLRSLMKHTMQDATQNLNWGGENTASALHH
jgi:hypothetical protein